ncbi:MAG: PAS domain S-box protein [Proteobacteria bacterium]|nr:PAS domain S-box protein [Pseudomonadota bacterium]
MKLAGAFHYSSSLVAILDAGEGCVVDVNPALENALGYRLADVVGKRTSEFGFWPDLSVSASIWARLRSERQICGETVAFCTRDGEQRKALLFCELFEEAGSAYVLAVFQQVRGDAAEALPLDPGSYHALFLSAAEGLYRSLPNGGWIDLNPAMARIFGYATATQMLAETATYRANQLYADADCTARLYALLDAHGQFENERARIVRRDGSIAWILENARRVVDANGKVLFYEGSIRDISEQLHAEERLRESEALYRILVDSSHDGVFLIHQDGVFGFVNEALARILDYSVDELVGIHYPRLIAPEALADQMQRCRALHRGEQQGQVYDTILLRKDGERRLLHIHAGTVDIGGRLANTGTARDVTDEHRQRQALETAERNYREMFQNSVAGMFRSTLDGRIAAANDAFARILGYADASALLESGRDIGDFYASPMQRKEVLARLVASAGPMTFEFDAIRCDGTVIQAEVRAQIVRNGNGDVQWTEGSAQDISARRRAEVALTESEARFRTLVEHSQVGVYMLLGDRYTYVNAAFAAMFGYSEAELTGADFRILVPPESSQKLEARFDRYRAGKATGGDYSTVLVRRDGERIDVVVSAGVVEMNGKLYATGTVRDVTAQLRVQHELEHNAAHDLLTGLPNRVYFERQLVQTIAHARASGDYHYALLFLDLDGFKLVNDSLGHASGDELLTQIGDCLRTELGGQCLVARYGGDEFTLLPHGPCPLGRAEQLAQRVLALLAASFDVRGHRVFSGASVGVVLGRPDYQTPDQLLRDADTAMYRAKAGGKSAYVIFDDAMHAAARTRLQMETDLRFALERGEFRIFHQPIVELRDGHVIGFEALVRWQHPQRGLLFPPDFLDVAEETGTLAAIDWWVLEQVCTNALRWQRRFPAHARLRASVNVDDRQFADPNLLEHLHAVLRRTGLDPQTLALEITETVFRRGREQAAQTLEGLKQLGVSLVVDDFGTGYSSLDSFAASPFDALKIDRSFIRDMATNFRHRAIVRTIAAFAEDLRLDLIAEGVETTEQASLLGDLGCRVAQGFLYAPALPQNEFEALLERGFANQSDSSPSAVA